MVHNQRQEDARRRQELADAGARAEAAAAQRLLDGFVAELTARAIAPEPLQATLLNGSPAKTDRTGWYLNKAHTVAVGADGSYYQLVVPGSRLARLRGVRLEPSAPSLVIGRGARDGESGDLSDFLARALHTYADPNVG